VCRGSPEAWPESFTMSYQVLARKWRPRTFDEVTGQEHVTKTLQNAIRGERIAHAFLFSGVRGVGKTTTARILAKALNCHQGPTPDPCGECVSCLEIAAANSVDVMEIDAASNRGIDDIRELRESVRYGAARDRFKIFIIDEVHMLTKEAFNALLKTLEEPPSHVKLILATTEHHKIPVTIASRCQQYDFKPIAFGAIVDRLRLITTEESIAITDYGLRSIAAMSQGSMRDAQSTLDRVIAFAGPEISDDDVRTILGVVDDLLICSTFDAVLSANRSALISQTQELINQGIDPLNFCRRLIEHVRNLMVSKVVGWDEQLLNLPDVAKETVVEQASQLSEVDLIRFYDLLNRTEGELRWHTHPAIHLEMALVKLVELARLPMLEEVVGNLRASPSKPQPPVRPDASSHVPSSRGSGSRAAASPPVPVSQTADKGPVASMTPSASPEGAGAEESQLPEQISPERCFEHLLVAVQRENPGLHEMLLHTDSHSFSNGVLELKYAVSVQAKVVGEPDNQKLLSRLLAKIAGAECRIVVRTDSEELPNRNDPLEDPAIRDFLRVFPGKVIVQRKVEN
jgi:DNA polymerase III subunit gamma/tau